MRAVDTNVIIRFLTSDDPVQASRARAIIGHEQIFVPRTVLLEVEWVLRGVYDLSPKVIIPALRALAGLPGVTIEDSALVARAMDLAQAGLDFADALHVAAAVFCTGFLTFDRHLARLTAQTGGIEAMSP